MKVTRRDLLGGGAALSLAPTGPATAAAPAAARPCLWYRRPAASWNEALAIGNGRLGAMVFGRVAQERLQLNESTLWAGGPYRADNPEALAALPRVRALIDAGRFKEADALAGERMMGRPLSQMPYGTLGDLLIDMAGVSTPDDYRRELDLRDAVATTTMRLGDRQVRREAFASAADQVIVLRLDATGSPLDLDLRYRGPRKAHYAAPDHSGPATDPAMSAAIDWLAREDMGLLTPGLRIEADGPHAILITGRNDDAAGIAGALRFAVRVTISADGAIAATPAGLSVRGGRGVTVLIAAATSFVSHRDVGADPVALVRATSRRAAAKPYATLRRDHIDGHRALFDGIDLDLGTSPAEALPTDERIVASATTEDPALAALYLQFARYLLLASSQPGGQPANLQGLWNEGTNPPWGSKYTININTQMNYWPADAVGLGQCVEPLVRMVEELAVTGAVTAHGMYGARGWVAHHNTDLWRATAPIDGPAWGLWPCGGAWLCNTVWMHWDYRRDPALLARLYPLLRGAALFFVDTLVEDPKGRGLVTSPSISPENQHPFGSAVCSGPAMDRQIVRDLFANTAGMAALLGQDADLARQLQALRGRIAPDRIGQEGQLQEWLEDWDAAAPDPHHRHLSHLYAVYPGEQINIRDTPALAEAARITLRQRGDRSTGWGTAWRACLWARLGDGEHAAEVLRGLLGPMRTYPNLFDAHPPFQIDGNFGGAAAIGEMLVQSWGGELRLLPALPQSWANGMLRGFHVRGGRQVDMAWRAGRVTRLSIRGRPGDTLRVMTGGTVIDARLDRSGRFAMMA